MPQSYAFRSIPKRPATKTPLEKVQVSIRSADVVEEWPTNSYPTPRTEPLPETPRSLPITATVPRRVKIYHTAWGMQVLSHIQAVHFAVTCYLHEYQSLPDGICVSKQCMHGYINEVLTFHQGNPYRFALPIGNQTMSIPIYADSRYGTLVPNRIQCFQFIDNHQ